MVTVIVCQPMIVLLALLLLFVRAVNDCYSPYVHTHTTGQTDREKAHHFVIDTFHQRKNKQTNKLTQQFI